MRLSHAAASATAALLRLMMRDVSPLRYYFATICLRRAATAYAMARRRRRAARVLPRRRAYAFTPPRATARCLPACQPR